MAEITIPRLELLPLVQTNTVRVHVTCEVHFTERETEIMCRKPELVYFQLSCMLLGKDLGKLSVIDTDDWIYTYPTQFFPDGTPSSLETATFDAVLGTGLLNEDTLGTDEIYARLFLRGRFAFWDAFTTATTNVVAYAV